MANVKVGGGDVLKRNTLICRIPGLRNPVEIAFLQSRKLPVCKKCKKIYKTRDLCRVRDRHTDLPWNTTYICFLADDSCFVNEGKNNAGAAGNNFIQSICKNAIGTGTGTGTGAAACGSNTTESNASHHHDDEEDDGFYIAETISDAWLQEAEATSHLNLKDFRISSDKLGPNPPICHDCKDKNYTRHYCRNHHFHTHLPWSTTYAWLKRRVDTTSTTTSCPRNKTLDDDATSSCNSSSIAAASYRPNHSDSAFMNEKNLNMVTSTNRCSGSSNLHPTAANRCMVFSSSPSSLQEFKTNKRRLSAHLEQESNNFFVKKMKSENEADLEYEIKRKTNERQENCLNNVDNNKLRPRMAFLLVIHEGNVSLHMLHSEIDPKQHADRNITMIPPPVTQNQDDGLSRYNNICNNNSKISEPLDNLGESNSYDYRDPPESLVFRSNDLLEPEQQLEGSPSSSSNSHYSFEPLPYNPGGAIPYLDYATHRPHPDHFHAHYDVARQEEQDSSFYSGSTGTNHNHSNFYYPAFRCSSHLHNKHSSRRTTDFFDDECRQPPSPIPHEEQQHRSIEPIDDIYYYDYCYRRAGHAGHEQQTPDTYSYRAPYNQDFFHQHTNPIEENEEIPSTGYYHRDDIRGFTSI